MKKLMVLAALCATTVAFAEEAVEKEGRCACAEKTACAPVPMKVAAKLSPAERKARMDEFQAKRLGISVEELSKLSKEERKAKLEQTKKDSKDLIDSFKSLFD